MLLALLSTTLAVAGVLLCAAAWAVQRGSRSALLLAGVLCILAAFCLDAGNPLPDAPGREISLSKTS